MRRKFLLTGFLLASALVFNGCGELNNPFLPKADLTITEVASTDRTKGVSIIQSYKKAGDFNIAEYKYNEPTVNIVNQPGLPRVIFKQVITSYTVGDQTLPSKQFPIAITIPRGGSYNGTVPVLALSEDLVNAVYPNNSFASNKSGFAEITLLGIDDNNNIVAMKFTTPLKFETDPTNFVVPENGTTTEDDA